MKTISDVIEDKKNFVEIKHPNFRPGTQTEMKEVVFNFMLPEKKSAAMGDMICWLPAIEFIAERYNFVLGHLVIPQFFKQIATRVLEKYPHWKIHTEIPDRLANGYPLKQQLEFPINATGMHLMDLGFIYFCHMNPPPEDFRRYPVLNLAGVKLPKELIGLRYAVMTPVIEAMNRKMPPDVFNAICDHLNQVGVTPVFLGKLGMLGRHGAIDEKYDLSKGVNLLNKTSLLEAAVVCDQSQMVIGIDNGLLHLAAMTPATILYGYTMTGPTQRRVHRRFGHTVELYDDRPGACRFCQEWIRFFFEHDFTNCVYREHVPSCVRALNKESWIANIDAVLKEKTP